MTLTLCIVIIGATDLCFQCCLLCLKFCFSTQITSLAFHGPWSRDIMQHQNCRDSPFGTVKYHTEVWEERLGATPNHTRWFTESSQADKCWFLMHNWKISSWSELRPTGGIHNTQSSHRARFHPPRAAVHIALGTGTDVQPIWGPLWKCSLSRLVLTGAMIGQNDNLPNMLWRSEWSSNYNR